MNWTELVPFLVVMGGLGTMWWRLDSKIESRVGSVETRIGGIETRIGRLEALLTDNLIALQSGYWRAERCLAHPHLGLMRRRLHGQKLAV